MSQLLLLACTLFPCFLMLFLAAAMFLCLMAPLPCRACVLFPPGRLCVMQDVDWRRPTAFVLGNEHAGVSQAVLDAADVTAVIPMSGLVESFNISVAAALILYEARRSRCTGGGAACDLDAAQQRQLLASFLMRSVVRTALCMLPVVPLRRWRMLLLLLSHHSVCHMSPPPLYSPCQPAPCPLPLSNVPLPHAPPTPPGTILSAAQQRNAGQSPA